MLHPRLNDKGQPVTIKKPSTPSAVDAWGDSSVIATATPDCRMPADINGVPVATWADAPPDDAGWEALGARATFDEPPMPTAPGKKPAAGVVTVEPDGRVWVVAPTDGFGGYTHTFPKGKLDGISTRASAIKEAREESGLQVELTGYLCDSVRTTSVTRYYLARRLGGNPADMSWESQAVMLVPMDGLRGITTHPNDATIVTALNERSIVANLWGLSSGHRILDTLAGYRSQFGSWPTRIVVERAMHDALRDTVLTPRGWRLVNDRLEVVPTDEPTLVAQGANGEHHVYDTNGPRELQRHASEWLWGVDLPC